MTNEEWDRKTEFLLNQQAKFEADMQELKEAQKVNDQKIAEAAATAAHAAETASHAAEAILVVVGVVTTLAETVKDLTAMMHEGFRKVFDSMKHTDDKIDVLVNRQMHTDEIMRETAALFERHIREDHGGLSGAEN